MLRLQLHLQMKKLMKIHKQQLQLKKKLNLPLNKRLNLTQQKKSQKSIKLLKMQANQNVTKVKTNLQLLLIGNN